MARRALEVHVSQEQRQALAALAARRTTAQALAMRARITCARRGPRINRSPKSLALILPRLANGGGGSSSAASMACRTSRSPACRAPSPMRRSRRLSSARLKACRGTRPIGVRGRWRRAAFRHRACSGFGAPLAFTRTAPRRSTRGSAKARWPRSSIRAVPSRRTR